MIEQPDINQPILVVEDEPDTADLVKLILQKMAIRSCMPPTARTR